ncbi:MAG: hypothetical protein GF330_12175 [Candidatus Eisenbacteria bacterium]|nr:hypothetical protein [Candidatus Eisenbacteria bacterium]
MRSYVARTLPGRGLLALMLCALAGGGLLTSVAHAEGPSLVDSDFEQNDSGKELRAREDPQGWYESRRDGKTGRLQLKRSTKKIGRNSTRKAMLKANKEHNTYLSQRFSQPIREQLSLQWDIYVREILPNYNRSAFQMVGNAAVRGRGPNGSSPERFVFLAFENAPRPGNVNLFAFEGKDPDHWDARTLLVRDLDLKKWHTIAVDIDIAEKCYWVSVPGVTEEPIRVQSFHYKGETPDVLTHVSFATWNDGPGTFYIDNVYVR